MAPKRKRGQRAAASPTEEEALPPVDSGPIFAVLERLDELEANGRIDGATHLALANALKVVHSKVIPNEEREQMHARVLSTTKRVVEALEAKVEALKEIKASQEVIYTQFADCTSRIARIAIDWLHSKKRCVGRTRTPTVTLDAAALLAFEELFVGPMIEMAPMMRRAQRGIPPAERDAAETSDS